MQIAERVPNEALLLPAWGKEAAGSRRSLPASIVDRCRPLPQRWASPKT